MTITYGRGFCTPVLSLLYIGVLVSVVSSMLLLQKLRKHYNCQVISFLVVTPAIPEERARKNSNLILITTGRGGHIGFMDRALPFGKCLMDRVLVQFVQLTLKHNAL